MEQRHVQTKEIAKLYPAEALNQGSGGRRRCILLVENSKKCDIVAVYKEYNTCNQQ